MKTVKSKVKNTLSGINNRFNTAEANLKTQQQTLQNEKQGKKKNWGIKIPPNQKSLSELWDNFTWSM